MGCGKLRCLNDNAQFFYGKSYDPRKSQFFDFVTVFSNFLTFHKNYPLKPQILVAMEKMGSGKLCCINDFAKVFSTPKVMKLGKVKFSFFFSPFFENF